MFRVPSMPRFCPLKMPKAWFRPPAPSLIPPPALPCPTCSGAPTLSTVYPRCGAWPPVKTTCHNFPSSPHPQPHVWLALPTTYPHASALYLRLCPLRGSPSTHLFLPTCHHRASRLKKNHNGDTCLHVPRAHPSSRLLTGATLWPRAGPSHQPARPLPASAQSAPYARRARAPCPAHAPCPARPGLIPGAARPVPGASSLVTTFSDAGTQSRIRRRFGLFRNSLRLAPPAPSEFPFRARGLGRPSTFAKSPNCPRLLEPRPPCAPFFSLGSTCFRMPPTLLVPQIQKKPGPLSGAL